MSGNRCPGDEPEPYRKECAVLSQLMALLDDEDFNRSAPTSAPVFQSWWLKAQGHTTDTAGVLPNLRPVTHGAEKQKKAAGAFSSEQFVGFTATIVIVVTSFA